MRPETLQTASQVILVIGILLTAAGTFGQYWFGKKAQHVQELKTEERHAEVLQRLAPFEEIAAALYPSVEKEEALEMLQRRLSRIESWADTWEQRAAPRELTQAQSQGLIEAIRPHAGTAIDVRYANGDQEAQNLAIALRDALNAAGWLPSMARPVLLEERVTGIFVHVQEEPIPQEAEILRNALSVSGLTVVGQMDKRLKANEIHLIIGSKPDSTTSD